MDNNFPWKIFIRIKCGENNYKTKTMKKIILISSSLSPDSLSRGLIKEQSRSLQSHGFQAEVVDLKEVVLPFCDGRALEDYPEEVQAIFSRIEKADGLVFGMPVYCYSLSGVLKNFIDLFAKSMWKKPFGICVSAGTKLSYLASGDLIKILSFESSAIFLSPTVLADHGDRLQTQNFSEKIQEKTNQLSLAFKSYFN
jgi:NAD(P)H-dependent FMN reductase